MACAAWRIHASEPNGRFRCTCSRNVFNSASSIGRFTDATQLLGRATGQSVSSPGVPARCSPLYRLPYGHASASVRHTGPPGIALDVPQHAIQVLVGRLDREVLESPLVQMALADVCRCSRQRRTWVVQTQRMKSLGRILPRPEHHVPVIGHQAERQDAHAVRRRPSSISFRNAR